MRTFIEFPNVGAPLKQNPDSNEGKKSGPFRARTFYHLGEIRFQNLIESSNRKSLSLNTFYTIYMPAKLTLEQKCLNALSTSKKGRIKVLQECLDTGVFTKQKFAKPLVVGLSDKSAVVADFIADEIFPNIGLDVLGFLLDRFSAEKESHQARRLRVIERISPDDAISLSRHSLNAKHEGLLLKSLQCLSGKEEFTEEFIERAKSKHSRISLAGFEALAGIHNEEARAFLMNCLKNGDQGAFFSLAYHPYREVIDGAIPILEELMTRVENGGKLNELETDAGSAIISGLTGQDNQKLDGILQQCLNVALNHLDALSSSAYSMPEVYFATNVFKAIVTNPVERSQAEVIKNIDNVDGRNAIYLMNAAALQGDLNLYDLFSPFLDKFYWRGRCRGWKCGCSGDLWPCSIISAIEAVLDHAPNPIDEFPCLPYQQQLVEKISDEKRWEQTLKALLKRVSTKV